ncbi:hypothetical protein J7E45_11360 [Microbacterium sp. ISL-59]|uniref:hypothetical protein n=1 Tax=Microbacterium sp. ISL-59 TaxID=2819159 RepID=UPI001BE5A8E0|nr:hypothetical protein [Microbacterium sp. ISL-59]MBT2496207.1 hypothetical protein [Microbacterium sp. ISL-59]
MTDEGPWVKIIGPCYTVSSMARALGWMEAEVTTGGNSLRLLMLTSDEGVLLFPAFQVNAGAIVAGLREVLRVLQTGVEDPWTWAQWLNSEPSEADPKTSIQLLYDGRIDEVLRDAEQDARSWSS